MGLDTKFRITVCLTVCVTLITLGCSTPSKDIVANPVSPVAYANYDCAQIGAEIQRVQGKLTAVGGKLDQAASNDAGLVTIGVILFFPTLFFLVGTKAREAEYAQLKGEYDALEKAAIEKRCTVASGREQVAPQRPNQLELTPQPQ